MLSTDLKTWTMSSVGRSERDMLVAEVGEWSSLDLTEPMRLWLRLLSGLRT